LHPLNLLRTSLPQTCWVQTAFLRKACSLASSPACVSRAAHRQMICRMCGASPGEKHTQIPDSPQGWLRYVEVAPPRHYTYTTSPGAYNLNATATIKFTGTANPCDKTSLNGVAMRINQYYNKANLPTASPDPTATLKHYAIRGDLPSKVGRNNAKAPMRQYKWRGICWGMCWGMCWGRCDPTSTHQLLRETVA
jgi:hypothetical protein